jgi:hypothetical protein
MEIVFETDIPCHPNTTRVAEKSSGIMLPRGLRPLDSCHGALPHAPQGTWFLDLFDGQSMRNLRMNWP